MIKKRLLVTFCTLVLAASTFAVGRRAESPRSAATPEIPDHITYRFLFHHAAAFKKQAEEAESQDKSGASYRSFFRNKAELSDEQARTLNEISAQCERDMHEVDMKAKEIVTALRAPYPDGQLPHGQPPPPPPAELKGLTGERDAIVLLARDRLRKAFGETEFMRFDHYVKHDIASKVQQLSAGRVGPESQIDAK